MNKQLIKLTTISIFFLLTILKTEAQQNHFIYIQSDNKQQFYVKVEGKLLSSTSGGYLIIPKLHDGTYTLIFGFPNNEWPEQNLTCIIDNKDLGYQLKNFDEKGWGLFNLQTLNIVMANKKIDENAIAENTKKPEAKQAPIDTNVPGKTDVKTIIETKPIEEIKTVVQEQPKPTVVEEPKPIEISNTEKNSGAKIAVLKLLSNSNANGIEMIFTDIINDKIDTIRVFIPAEKVTEIAMPVTKSDPIIQKVEEKPVAEINPDGNNQVKEEPKKSDPKFIDMSLPNPNAKVDTINTSIPIAKTDTLIAAKVQQAVQQIVEEKKPEPEKVVAIKTDFPAKVEAPVKADIPVKAETSTSNLIANSDCKNLASNDDFLKLRKKMAAETNDESMIAIAIKFFKTACFTTEQIKNLSVLFLNDNGKYKFFDAAYPFVFDSNNFSSLQNQLSNAYYINRFKAMVTH